MTSDNKWRDDKTEHLDYKHARTEEQVRIMEQSEKDGVCPFCEDQLKKYHPKPIIKETDWWFLTENIAPYEGTSLHLIVIYKKHVSAPTEVPPEHMAEMFELLNWAIKENAVVGGSILIRFGDSRYTGGSVTHFHAHLVVGNTTGDDPNAKSLKKKIGYMKEV